MKFSRNPDRQAQRVDRRKADRPNVVREVPDNGEEDDVVVVKDDDGVSDILMRVEGEWISLFNVDGNELEAVPEVNANPGVRKRIQVRYTIGGHPRSRPKQFKVVFTNENGNTVTPDDVVLTPDKPSRNAGSHILTIDFTPQTTGQLEVNVTLS